MTPTIFTITAEIKLQKKALKAIFEALELPYTMQKEEKPYDPEFVAKIK